jgi:serine/threonine-protein kinase
VSRLLGAGVLVSAVLMAACGSATHATSGTSASGTTGTGGTGGDSTAGSSGGSSTGAPGFVSTLAGSGSTNDTCRAWGTDTVFSPLLLALDGAGNVYVTSDALDKIDRGGKLTNLGSFGSSSPNGLTVTVGGSAFYSVTANFSDVTTIVELMGASVAPVFDEGPSCEDTSSDAGGGLGEPAGLAVDSTGNIYVADEGCYKVREVIPDGGVSTLAGSGNQGYKDGAGSMAEFSALGAIAIDPSGNLYVVESDTGQIRKILPDGTTSTVARYLRNVAAVAADAAGNVYFSDYQANIIRKIDSSGKVTTLAGDGTQGYRDGPLETAEFNNPQGLAVDGSGNVYVADNANCYVRVIHPGQ